MSGRQADQTQYWIDVLHGKRTGLRYSPLLTALRGASSLYSAGLEVYLGLERMGIRRRAALPVPAISIGNLSSGGTGKTPMTQYVAETLHAEGFRPLILSRGHGGSLSRHATQVSDDAGNVLHTAAEAGDEATALASLIPGVPVYVGKDRRQSAALALERYRPDVILLDDGLQYWQLERDLDIVLLDSRMPFDNGYPLPRGLLREPKEHLRRAGLIVITRSDLATQSQLAATYTQAERLAPNTPIFTACHRFAGFRPLNEAARGKPPSGRAMAVCGIAQPEAFLSLLRQTGILLAEEMLALPDHAVYDAATIGAINQKARSERADCLITTDKDAVKLAASEIELPVYSAGLRIEIERAEEFDRELKSRARLVRAAS